MKTVTTGLAAVIALGVAMSAPVALQAGESNMQTAEQTTNANIVETAQAAGQFQTLLAAAQAAGLVDTLSNGGPFTLFAPTDAAFAALPEGTVESLLEPENREQLAAILKYHVIPGRVMSGDIAGTQASVQTIEGRMLQIDARDGVIVGGANVISADVAASNGVIHVVDKVILPPQE